jgi:hypothetical protein
VGHDALVHGRGRDAGNRRRTLRISEAGVEVVKAAIGWGFPAVAGALVIGAAFVFEARPPVAYGVSTGVGLAVLQAYLSTAALRWTWNHRSFWWVWGAGVLFRMVVFAATAFVVYRFTHLNLVATMASMVVCTTAFLVVESATCLKG